MRRSCLQEREDQWTSSGNYFCSWTGHTFRVSSAQVQRSLCVLSRLQAGVAGVNPDTEGSGSVSELFSGKYRNSILNSLKHKKICIFGSGAVFLIPPPVCSRFLPPLFSPHPFCPPPTPLPPPRLRSPPVLGWPASSKAGPKLPNPIITVPSVSLRLFYSCLLLRSRTPRLQMWFRRCPGSLENVTRDLQWLRL